MTIESITKLKKGLRTTLTNVPALIDTLEKGISEIDEEISARTDVKKAGSNFDTINGGLLTECKVELTPIQDLSHGAPSAENICAISGHTQVTVDNTGKNKLPIIMASGTSNGITAIVYDDGSILVNGTATGLATFTLNNTLTLNGNYILSGCPSGGTAATYRMDCYWTGQGALIDNGNGVAISPNGNAITTRIIVMQGVTVNNILFKPMIRLATDTDPEYAPYLGYQHTTNLGNTYYSGVLDIASGILTVDTAYIASYDGETLPSTWISDRDVYAAGTTPTTGAEVVYKLATPINIQLTPANMRALTGENNIIATLNGQEIVEVGYKETFTFEDVEKAIDNAVASIYPTTPETDGTYVLTLVKSGSSITRSWENTTSSTTKK